MTAQFIPIVELTEVLETSTDVLQTQYTKRVFVVEVIDQDGNTYNNN